jgi:transcriptional regulator with GAF, ATPase, and Fis domain
MMTVPFASHPTHPTHPRRASEPATHDVLVGQSGALRAVLAQVDRVAATDATVLLLGETGTGKGLLARIIHERSRRHHRPFIEVNCAALPATLIESELFGHDRGAYTGAVSSQPGRFELAHGGTIFLDEIGELPLELQAKLLRVLQDRTLERLGSGRSTHVDVRVIAATNRSIHADVREGRFRQDLFYRLNVFPISSPPLRERREDIPNLVEHFVVGLGRRHGRAPLTVPPDVMAELVAHDWPGNVRELEHVIERAIILCNGHVLRLDGPLTPIPTLAEARAAAPLLDIEREHIARVLEATKWRIEGQRGAAAALGLRPSTLRSRMQKLNICRPAAASDHVCTVSGPFEACF